MTSPYANKEDLRYGFQSYRSQRITLSRERREHVKFLALCKELQKKNRTDDDRLVDRERRREYVEKHPDRVRASQRKWNVTKRPAWERRRRRAVWVAAGPVQCKGGCGTEWCRVPDRPGRGHQWCWDCNPRKN